MIDNYADELRQNERIRRWKRKQALKNGIRFFLSEHPCVDCGEADPIVLDFDHVRGEKYKDIAELLAQVVSFKLLIAEMKKCEVRCANCHRRITHKRREARRLLLADT